MIHLHVHTSFSDGFGNLSMLQEACEENKIEMVCITDHNNLYAHYKYDFDLKSSLTTRYVYGCEVSLEKNKYHITVLPRSELGYVWLVNLLKCSDITLDMLYDNDEIVVLSGCPKSIFVENEHMFEVAARRIPNFFAELVLSPNTELYREAILHYARKYKVPLVITNDVHFYKKEHAPHANLLQCLKYNQKTYERRYTLDNSLYLMSKEEFVSKLRLYGITNEEEIFANLYLVQELLKDFSLPVLQPLKIQSMDGLSIEDYINYQIDTSRLHTDKHREKLNEELAIIREKGMLEYFAVVRDIINYAEKRNKIVGGRGSAAGSVLSYCLHIGNVDPLKYGLRFDRFIDPTRVEYPDIDLDFSSMFIDELRDYVLKKYGTNNVTGLCAYVTFTLKSLVSDISRLSDMKIDTKYNPDLELGILTSNIKNQNPYFQYIEEFKDIIKHISKHAAGIVLGNNISFYTLGLDKYDADKLGLIKLDLLARAQLSVLEHINAKHFPSKEMYDKIHEKMLYTICDQCDGSAITKVLQLIKPNTLTELSNAIALGRAPSLLHKQDKVYHDRKFKTRSYSGVDAWLVDKFPEQHGVLMYQEQILDILKNYGKFSPNQLMKARKAISKTSLDIEIRWKDLDVLYPVFLQNSGFSESFASELWKKIKDAALYSFNMAHSISYAYNAECMMYHKIHNPLKFYYSAILVYGNLYYDTGDKDMLITIRKLICEAMSLGIRFIHDDIDMMKNWTNGIKCIPKILDNENTIILPIYAKSTVKLPIKKAEYLVTHNPYDIWKYFPLSNDKVNVLKQMNYDIYSIYDCMNKINSTVICAGMIMHGVIKKYGYVEGTLFDDTSYINIRIYDNRLSAIANELEKSNEWCVCKMHIFAPRNGKIIDLYNLNHYIDSRAKAVGQRQ